MVKGPEHFDENSVSDFIEAHSFKVEVGNDSGLSEEFKDGSLTELGHLQDTSRSDQGRTIFTY